MSIMASMASALGGAMEAGASAMSTMGEYAGKATDAMGMTDNAGTQKLEELNWQLTKLREEAEFIKTSGGPDNAGGYADEAARDTDLAENAARTQEVINQIDEIEKSQASQSSGLEGTLEGKRSGGAKASSSITGTPGVSTGQFSSDALVGAANSGLQGVLGGAPKTTQQQLIQSQHQAFGGFKV